MASPESAGVGGQRRLDLPWNLYVRELPGGQPQRMARGADNSELRVLDNPSASG